MISNVNGGMEIFRLPNIGGCIQIFCNLFIAFLQKIWNAPTQEHTSTSKIYRIIAIFHKNYLAVF